MPQDHQIKELEAPLEDGAFFLTKIEEKAENILKVHNLEQFWQFTSKAIIDIISVKQALH